MVEVHQNTLGCYTHTDSKSAVASLQLKLGMGQWVEWEPGIVDCRLAPVVVRREIRAERAGRAEDWMLGS